MRRLLIVAIILAVAYLLSGCMSKEELSAKGKQLCGCRSSTLWYMDGTMAHCSDGTNFFNVDELVIHETCQ